MTNESNNQKTVKQALLDTITKIPEEKLKFIKGQVVVNINGSNIAVSIQEFLEPNKYNLKN